MELAVNIPFSLQCIGALSLLKMKIICLHTCSHTILKLQHRTLSGIKNSCTLCKWQELQILSNLVGLLAALGGGPQAPGVCVCVCVWPALQSTEVVHQQPDLSFSVTKKKGNLETNPLVRAELAVYPLQVPEHSHRKSVQGPTLLQREASYAQITPKHGPCGFNGI